MSLARGQQCGQLSVETNFNLIRFQFSRLKQDVLCGIAIVIQGVSKK